MDDPSPLPPLGPLVLGSAARLVGVERVWILVDLIFPPLIFLLACGIIYLLTKSFFVSVSTGIIFIFFREIASLFPFSKLYQLKAFLASFKPLVNSAVAVGLEAHYRAALSFRPERLSFGSLICPTANDPTLALPPPLPSAIASPRASRAPSRRCNTHMVI